MSDENMERPEELVTIAIQRLRRVKTKRQRYIYPLWVRVGKLFGYENDPSLCVRICRQFGFDSDEQWNLDEQWAQRQNQARTWTPDRPTKPGEYWLSFAPDKRNGESAVLDVRVAGYDRFPVFLPGGKVAQTTHSMFDGALWAPRETPADPFKEVGT